MLLGASSAKQSVRSRPQVECNDVDIKEPLKKAEDEIKEALKTNKQHDTKARPAFPFMYGGFVGLQDVLSHAWCCGGREQVQLEFTHRE